MFPPSKKIINQQVKLQKNEDTQPKIQTMQLETAPVLSVSYDSSWSRLTEYGYPRDGLTKTINGTAFLISFSRNNLSYDYMNRAAGGAYPPGELHKEINANGKTYYVGITKSVASAFLSTCPPTPNGACSLSLPEGYGYMIVDLQRFTPSSSDYKARSPLVMSETADQKAVEEFAAIMSTVTF